MKILFILGNGFDINLGLKTKYSEFYKYYERQKTENEEIKKLKEEIKLWPDTWSDFEKAFGVYTSSISSIVELEVILGDVIKNLAEYLDEAEKELNPTLLQPSVLAQSLIHPEEFLPSKDRREIKKYKEAWNKGSWRINVISLNYTKTFEMLMPNKRRLHEIGDNGFGQKAVLDSIEHIHGKTTERMILGVSEPLQILNEKFQKSLEAHESMVKETANQVSKEEVDETCYNMIKLANLIVVFGSSLGETDKYLWKKIGDRLLNASDSKLILFIKGEEINKRIPKSHWDKEKIYKDNFIQYLELSDQEKNAVRDKIYIGYNRGIFPVNNIPIP